MEKKKAIYISWKTASVINSVLTSLSSVQFRKPLLSTCFMPSPEEDNAGETDR